MTPRLAYRRAAAIAAREHELSLMRVLRPKGRDARRARHQAIYIAHVMMGVSQRQVACAAGLALRAVQKAVGTLEDARDNPDIDRRLTTLEERLA